MTERDETPLQAVARGAAGVTDADAVLAALLAGVGEGLDLLRRVVRGEEALSKSDLMNVSSPEGARLDAARFLVGHAAPLLAELRALRAATPPAEPGGPSPVRRR
ncbi:MAG TPA: hypothetical protein VFA70_06090 [Dehalococcoidia bacterium]|nr:hypothetical protein [Dehalococcoidia bacterium]